MSIAGLSMVQSTSSMKRSVHGPVSSLSHRKGRSKSKEKEGIHSGHFMVSCVHDNTSGDYLSDEENLENDVQHGKRGGFNFSEASKDTCKTYIFGNRPTQQMAIDESLSNLFKHLTLAYSGKISSPKWKQFRGMHMNVKEKIRVNNLIWREWYMQYIFDMQATVCHFATPLQELAHNKPEAVVVEGYYWKRRLDTIANEYKRWRKYYRAQRLKHSDNQCFMDDDHHDHLIGHDQLLERVSEVTNISSIPRQQQTSHTDLMLNTSDAQEMMDLSESLFSSLKHPFDFPTSRELSGFGYGDYIQPSLLQLQPVQPNLEDFMEFESMHDLWNIPKSSSSSHTTSTDTGQTSTPLQSSSSHVDMDLSHSPLLIPESPGLVLSPQTPPSQTQATPTMFDSPMATPSPVPTVDTQSIIDSDFIMNQLVQIQQQKVVEQQKVAQQLQQQQHEKQLQEQKLLEQQVQQQQQTQMQDQILALLQNQELIKTLIAQGNVSVLNQLIQEINQQQKLTQAAQSPQQQQQPPSPGQQQVPSPQAQQPLSPQTPMQHENSLLYKLMHTPNSPGGAAQRQLSPKPSPPAPVAPQQIAVSAEAPGRLATPIKPKASPPATAGSVIAKSGLKGFLEAISEDESLQRKLKPAHQNMQTSMTKTAGFKKPDAPLARGRGRGQRPLAPSPAVTSQQSNSSNSSYLAQLLTTGTYKGAMIQVKDEGGSRILSQLQAPPISQLATTQNSAVQPQPISVTDFQTSVLLAAVNHAIGPSQMSPAKVFETVNKQGTSMAASSPASMLTISPLKTELVSDSPSPVLTTAFSPVSPASTSGNSFDEGFMLKSPDNLYSEMQMGDDKEDKMDFHLTAEKKRRNNIKSPGQLQKSGFDLLHSLIPSLRQNPNAKVSKAMMLQKTAEYCKKLKTERSQMQKEADILKQEIGSLNQSISICQSQLPATGVPVTRQRADQMRELFDEYVKQRTLRNWKFWIFSLIIDRLFETYNTMVSTASMDELCRTVLAWLDQHCSLPALRPIVSDAMRHLSTKTSILSDPSRVPEQAAQAVIKRQKHQSGGGNSTGGT